MTDLTPIAQDPLVLIVEDDDRVADAVSRVLVYEGYDVVRARDGAAALGMLDADPPDLILLDVALPVMDGLETCRRLRADGNRTPVLMLTARAEVGDRVAGLDAGADDYLAKPFDIDELLARIRALLRRTSLTGGGTGAGVGSGAGGAAGADPSGATTAELRYADVVVDPLRRQAFRGTRELELTKTEFDLLELLVADATLVLTRDTIYERIWGYAGSSSKTLDVYVGYLRRKTEAAGEPRVIHTVRGIGYTLRAD